MKTFSAGALQGLLVSAFLMSGCRNDQPVESVATAKKVATQLEGKWHSDCAPMSATQGFKLDFAFTPATWALDYAVYGDTTCTTKFMTVHIEGPYEVGALSPAAAETYDAKFSFSKKTITPHSSFAAEFLAGPQGCMQSGFVADVAKDITTTGCAALGQQPVAACDADYDLVNIQNNNLRFGTRPADNNMCTPGKRPTALSPLSSRRMP